MSSFLSFVLMGPCSTLNHGITVGSHGHMGYSVFVHFGGSGSDLSHLSDRLDPRVLPSVPSHIAVVLSSPTCSQLAHAREVIPYRLRHTLKSTPLSAEQRANHSGRFNSPKLWISPPQFSSSAFGPLVCAAVTELCPNQELGRWPPHPQSSRSVMTVFPPVTQGSG